MSCLRCSMLLVSPLPELFATVSRWVRGLGREESDERGSPQRSAAAALRPQEHRPRPGGVGVRRDGVQRGVLRAGRRDPGLGVFFALSAFPGADLVTATLISLVINIPIGIMMALMASSMPPTGGEH